MSDRSSDDKGFQNELHSRLTALASAVMQGGVSSAPPPVGARRPTEAPVSDLSDPLVQAIATATDRLLSRIATVTTQLRLRPSRLDDVDVVSARLLLSDLDVLTSIWQTLGLATRHTLDAAQAELEHAKGASRGVADDPEDSP